MTESLASAILAGAIRALRKRSFALRARAASGVTNVEKNFGDAVISVAVVSPEARLDWTLATHLDGIAADLEAGGA